MMMPSCKNIGRISSLWWLFGCWVTLCLCWPAGSVATTLYRCVDSAGQVQFQQIACADSIGGQVEVEVNTLPWRQSPKSISKRRPKAQKKAQPAVISRSDRAKEERCWRAEQRVESASTALRRGYNRAQGERLRAKRQRAEDYLRQFCR